MTKRIDSPYNLWIRSAGIWVLLLPGVIAFQPTFGGVSGYFPALVGVTLGCVLGLAAVRFRWTIAWWFLGVIGSYLVVGSPLVLPRQALFGFLPTPTTIGRLIQLVWQGWLDLLTVATPAGDFGGPAAVPLLSGLVFGTIAIAAVGRTNAVLAPLTIPITWLGFAILFGTRVAPTSAWLGVALGIGMLTWTTAHNIAASNVASAQIFVNSASSKKRLIVRIVGSVLMIALAGTAGIAVNAVTGERINRKVLRDLVEPPLDPTQFASPLMKYRLYELDFEEKVLFEVRGMPADARLRLAVMDTYDGNVFNVSQNSSHYLRTGRTLPVPPTKDGKSVRIEVKDAYSGVWVPSPGNPTRIEFSGDNANSEFDGLHFNKSANQLLTTGELRPGSVIELEVEPVPVLPRDKREGLGSPGPGKAPLARVSNVPDIASKLATDWSADAESALDQVQQLEEQLREVGFYSNGRDGKSRSGHTTERLGTMLVANQMVGDDEQYATAMALMASQLGIPARVVLGFYPEKPLADNGNVWEVLGTEAHVWVEANLDGVGWVAFDPTPDRDKEVKTDTPKPKPKPKPQVEPPPDPPERIPEEPVLADDDAADADKDKRWEIPGWLAYVGAVIGIGLLAASPFVGIVALKTRRTKKRRTTGTGPDRLAGAWDDVVDTARDFGFRTARSLTRQESALQLAEEWPGVGSGRLAWTIDAQVFGPGEPAETGVEQAWSEAEEMKHSLTNARPWYLRVLAMVSPRSLGRPRIQLPTQSALRRILPTRKESIDDNAAK